MYNKFMKILCPVCKECLEKQDRSYKCINNHTFDIAKQGYLNLNMKASDNTGDEKEMIKARNAFLNAGYYNFLKDKINQIIDSYNPNNILDLACGEGYYTSSYNIKDKVGIDLSKEALKIASRNDSSTMYILKNIFDVPFKDDSLDMIITIFAPISKEISRLLKDDGHFILVKPDTDHLFELKKAVYDNPYLNEVEDIKIENLRLEKEYKFKQKAILNNEMLNNLFKMTPYYHKTSINDMKKLETIDSLQVSFSFIIDVYLTSK